MNRKNDDKIACLNAELFNSIPPEAAVQMLGFEVLSTAGNDCRFNRSMQHMR